MAQNEPELATDRPTPSAGRRLVVTLFVIAMLANLSILWLHYNPEEKFLFGDENYNHAVARALAAGESFLPDPAWPPLYVHSLAAIFSFGGSGHGTVQAVQIVMWLLGGFFLYRIGLRLLPWRGAATAALALFLFSPELIAFCHHLWPEIPHLFFFLGSLWLLICHGHRTGAIVAAGIMLGLALLTKLLVLPFTPVLVAFVLFRSREGWSVRILRGAILALAAFVVVLPTMLNNLDDHGRFMIADSSMFNLWLGLNDSSRADYRDDITEKEYREFRRSARGIVAQNRLYRGKINRLVEERGVAGTLSGQVAKQYFRLFDCRSFFTTQLPGGPRRTYAFESPVLAGVLRAWSFALHGLLVAAFGIGVFLSRWRKAGWLNCIVLFVIYNLALFLFLHTKTRYFVQLVPMMALFAGAALEWFRRRITGAPRATPGLGLGAPRLAAGLGLALLFLLLSFRNLI